MDGLVLTCRVRINFLSILLFLVGFVIGGFLMSKMFLTRKVESPMMLNNFNYEHKLATKLFHEAKILCLVMTNPNNHRTKADHVKNTWGRRCNKLLFITTQDDDELDTIVVAINESRQALRRKTKTGFLYVHENYLDEYDWFMKADDDRFGELCDKLISVIKLTIIFSVMLLWKIFVICFLSTEQRRRFCLVIVTYTIKLTCWKAT